MERRSAARWPSGSARRTLDLFPPDEAEQFRGKRPSVLASGTPVEFVETATSPDGVRHYLSFKFPLRDGDGRLLLAGMSLDITDRSGPGRARAVLAVGARASSGRSWQTGPQRASRSVASGRLTLVPDELGPPWADFLRPDGRRDRGGRAGPAGPCVYGLRVCYRVPGRAVPRLNWRRAGSRRGLIYAGDAGSSRSRGCGGRAAGPTTHAAPLRGPDGQCRQLGITHDVTDRKRAERRLAEAHEFLNSSLDALSSHIAVLDEGGVILAVNDAWRRFADENQYTGRRTTGWGPTTSRRASRTRSSASRPTWWRGCRDVLAGRLPYFEFEYPCHSPTEERWFVMRATRFDRRGRCGCVVAHEDVTKRKRAEEALQEADRRKDEFLAMLAHELRNPLAPIRNALQVLRLASGERRGRSSRPATMMERQVGQMVRLVDDLLDVSRITRGKIELRKERVELAAVVQQRRRDEPPADRGSAATS